MSANLDPIHGSSVSGFPELPKINGDVILEAFSHKSLSFAYNPDRSFDNERLAELGKTVLQLAVTNIIYRRRPVIKAADIPTQRNKILSPEMYEIWVSHYGLRQRLRYNHSDTLDISTPEETKNLFHAYVGAVFTQSGPHITINWITKLVDPEAVNPVPTFEEDSNGLRVSKRPRGDFISSEISPSSMHSSSASGSASAALSSSTYNAAVVPVIGSQTLSDLSFSSIPKPAPKPIAFLPLFNQRCSQQHLQLEYVAENHGAPHAPLWVIKCIVNGIQKGQGQGTSKQIAKEAAAREAYFGLGWGGYGQHTGISTAIG
ncbi:hypothetical protein M0805_000979 [Coniferiporia weirii]|nr:hypothetical protein M0805_000979 [Coniferiporia weirii]